MAGQRMTDPTPAAGGLSEDTVARDLTEAIMRHYGYTDADMAAAEQIHPGRVCDEACLNEDGYSIHPDVYDELHRTASLMVEVVSPYIAARTEAAERELARVTAAVEALADWLCAFDIVDMPVPDSVDVPDDYELGINDAGDRLRAALSSADTGALDRERAKAAGEALREAADRGRKFLGDTDGSICWDWLADRAAAVSPEGGGA